MKKYLRPEIIVVEIDMLSMLDTSPCNSIGNGVQLSKERDDFFSLDDDDDIENWQ